MALLAKLAHVCTRQTTRWRPSRGCNNGVWAGLITSRKFSSKLEEDSGRGRATQRPVCFWFWGLNRDIVWPGMARDMLKLDPFHMSLLKSNLVLRESLGDADVHLLDLVTTAEDEAFECYVNQSIASVGMQIALVDTLRSFGIEPDMLTGISMGELTCGYVDGCLSRKEALLCSYWRTKCLLDADVPPCYTAFVAIPPSDLETMLPRDIKLVIDGSTEGGIISGTSQSMDRLLKTMTDNGVFVHKMAPNIGGHNCHVVAPAVPILRKQLDKILQNPRQRSPRWVSSFLSESEWMEMGNVCSTEYIVQNMVGAKSRGFGAWGTVDNSTFAASVRPVMLRQRQLGLPPGGIVVEVSPNSFMKKTKLQADVDVIPVMMHPNPSSSSSSDYFLSAVQLCLDLMSKQRRRDVPTSDSSVL